MALHMDIKIDYSKIYSPTRLKMFDQCPKSYHFYYLDPIYSKMKNDLKKFPQNIWNFQTLGKAVHNAITLFYHSQPEQRTQTQLKEQLKQAWLSEVMWNKKPPLGEWGGFTSMEEERDFYRQALEMLFNFLKIAEIEPEIEYLPTKDFKRSIDDFKNLIIFLTDEIDISGKFDLVTRNADGSLKIIDFKTGKKEEENQFQLRFYKLLAEAKFGKKVRKASFFFLKTGRVKEYDLDQEASQIQKEVLNKIGLIKTTEEFVAKTGPLCRFCLFKDFCPEKEKVKKILEKFAGEDHADDLPF